MKKQLSNRDEQILLLLKKFDYLTRDQLNRYFNLGKVRNANRVLNALSEYLGNYREGNCSVYYLNKFGRLYVECEKVRKKGNIARHTVMRNELYLYYNCPADWKNEVKISDCNTTVIADSMFSRNGFRCFLEVDHLQTMKENREKIKRYKELMPSIALKLSYYPTLIWLTTTELRRKQLEEACSGLKFQIFTMSDIK